MKTKEQWYKAKCLESNIPSYLLGLSENVFKSNVKNDVINSSNNIIRYAANGKLGFTYSPEITHLFLYIVQVTGDTLIFPPLIYPYFLLHFFQIRCCPGHGVPSIGILSKICKLQCEQDLPKFTINAYLGNSKQAIKIKKHNSIERLISPKEKSHYFKFITSRRIRKEQNIMTITMTCS